jgi:hypothetical protein
VVSKITELLGIQCPDTSYSHFNHLWSDYSMDEVEVMPTKRYQKQEMLLIARKHDFEVTEHLLKDWVEKGLLGVNANVYLT